MVGMSEILRVTENSVKIGEDSGNVIEVPIAVLQFSNPIVGDKVKVYRDGDATIVRREETITNAIISNSGDRRKVNKIVYVLLTFFLGYLGVHRFMRGQVGLGILMILIGWLTLGIWWLVDFIISLVKLSEYQGDDFIFTSDGRFAK